MPTPDRPDIHWLSSDEGQTLVAVPSGQGKSLMPDHGDLTMSLAEDAFKLLGSGHFEVSASLSKDHPDTLRNFGLFESVLLMAYRRGVTDCLDGKAFLAPTHLTEAEALLGGAAPDLRARPS